jgi:hypothetical protein
MIVLASVVMLLVGGLSLPAEALNRPRLRMVGLGFEDVVDGAAALPRVRRNLDRVGANGVSLSVGRVDWTAFPSVLSAQGWSGAVQRTHRDYVAEAIHALGRSRSGKRRSVVLVIDTLVEGWIARDPSIAGVDAQGRPSSDFPSLAQLESGAVGQRIVAFAGEVAARYRPAAVSLTELFNAAYTYGADDLASFRSHTGAPDWPRTASGAIDEADPAIARWRCSVIAGLVARARDATNAARVPLWMEVRVNWSDPSSSRLESGHDQDLLLQAADRLVLWGYFAMQDRPPSSIQALARASARRAKGRTVMSVGLWGAGDSVVTPGQLRAASQASVRGGVPLVWVTPNSLMTPKHWAALEKAWRR